MSCFAPISIKDANNRPQSVNCGRCNFCRRDKKNDWCFRLMQHERHSKNSLFVTLTYDNAHLPREPIFYKDQIIPNPNGHVTLLKNDLQQFHKSLKEHERLTHGKTEIDYYAAGEYGSKFGRPHYHTILMNVQPTTTPEYINSLWDKGRIHIGTVTPASVAYVSKYIIDKKYTKWHPVKPFNMMSKGIGANYLTPQMLYYHKPDDDMDNAIYYVLQGKFKRKMPRYYRDRIFNDNERRELGHKQYQLGLEQMMTKIEYLAMQELATNEIKLLDEYEQGMKAWQKGLERYLEQVEHKHEKIGIKSLQCNTL